MVAIDSNRYTDFCRGEQRAVEVLQESSEILVPLIVVAEQRAGFAHGSRRERNEQILTRFLNAEGVEVLAPDEQTTHFYAELYAYLRKRATPIPTNDLWIAALVTQHDAVLFDRDAHFDRLPQLARLA
jgi:predicted nucleic acid-binding protein